MQTFFDAFRNVIINMEAIGWAPWPIIFSSAMSVMIRGYFEEDVIAINSIKSKREQGKAKILAFLGSYLISILASYGFDYPKNDQEQIQIICFSSLNAGIGHLSYTAWSIFDPIGRFRDKYGRRGQDAPSSSGDPAVKP